MLSYWPYLNQILNKNEKHKQKILKKLRLVRLCLNILFKWSQDINNLKPAILASERCTLLSWDWIAKNKHFDKDYIKKEFYLIFSLKRRIGITFFNKVASHYTTQHSIYRYSKNNLEYSLNCWEHLGILSTIGLTELQEFKFLLANGKEEEAKVLLASTETISSVLATFIANNPPLNTPNYDEHSIEIALALRLLWITGKKKSARNWINNIAISLHNNFAIYKTFPLFRTNFDRLVEIKNSDEKSEVDSSMILVILLEYTILLDDSKLYDEIKSLVNNKFPKVNLQIWFATEEVESFFCSKRYSQNEGTLKHSIQVFEDLGDYKNEIVEEMDLFIKEKDFEFYTSGFHIIGHIASRHFRAQPFPIFWRLPIARTLEFKL